MIAVIADDLSGAAELANAAVEAGFSAEVQVRAFVPSDADVVCVDTETRSLPPAAAAATAGEVAQAIASVRPVLVYKKCDSVLRGPVAAESLAIARALEKTRVLLVPANPSRQRIIRGGEYFVEGVPLNQTAFAHDPEHPRRSSRVTELLASAYGIETPDTANVEDLKRHAATVVADTLAAGGVDFFGAVLDGQFGLGRKGRTPGSPAKPREGASLFVCGSNAAWLAGRCGEFAERGIPAIPAPAGLFELKLREGLTAQWAAAIAAGLREHGSALLAIGDGQPEPGLAGDLLAGRLAQVVKWVIETTAVGRIFLEGGATALAVVHELGLHRFRVEKSPGVGVGALRPAGQSGPLFLIKPGSYRWPEAVWSHAGAVQDLLPPSPPAAGEREKFRPS